MDFTIRAVADTRTEGGAADHTLEVLGARMKWRVLQADDTRGWQVAAVLEDVELESSSPTPPATLAAMREPFLFHIARNCHLHDFAFRPSSEPRASARLLALLRGLEVRLPAQPATSFWTAVHEDGVGRYTALYRHLRSTAAGEAVLHRTRGPYLSASGPGAGAFSAEVREAEATLVLAAGGRWLQELEATEHLVLAAGGSRLADLRQQLRLQQVEETGTFPEDLDPATFVVGNPMAALKSEPPPPDPRMKGMPLEGVLDEVAAMLAGADRPAHDVAEVLAQYLRLHPEKASELLTALRTGRYADELHALAFLALEVAGTPESQRVLLEALKEGGLGTMDRMRAAVALPDVPTPTRDSVEGLIEVARSLPDARGDADVKVAGTALRALGSVSAKVEASQPELARLARAEIRAGLASARDGNALTSALDAVGNSGDETMAGELERFQRSDMPLVRARAAQAYRRMEMTVATPALAEWLGREPDVTVRRSIADALLQVSQAARGAPVSEDVVALAARQLPAEPDPRMRELLIQVLGTAVQGSPLARAALAAHYHREGSPQLLALLGRYIGPEDLD
ncbi:hypothetical protein [Pyxidicoccus xibeiensis]|uniref:hypothetical protein n=1 Tax=Pyxidicoccus xibeiensis TaxID=2906759 RepID=UPI0020A7A99E|nr:hypothetical protein [Pyxidicoccus xibeiensis]MCP3143146.1 hypothetical protein [Pyxidicoccus xibeiensis]